MDQKISKPLSGGINNTVNLEYNETGFFVRKSFDKALPTSRNRFNAETSLLQLASVTCEDMVPQLLNIDHDNLVFDMEYIKPDNSFGGFGIIQDVTRAMDFWGHLNQNRGEAEARVKNLAVDSSPDIRSHLENVSQRISCFTTDKVSDPHLVSSAQMILHSINEKLEIMHQDINKSFKNQEHLYLCPREQFLISPGDFGFHNAIKSRDRFKFIDFEFGGWDDPAKTFCDFYLQPDILIDPKCIVLPKIMARDSDFLKRISVMADIIYLKWLVIILGLLDTTRYVRLKNLRGEAACNTLMNRRIIKASNYMNNRLSIVSAIKNL